MFSCQALAQAQNQADGHKQNFVIVDQAVAQHSYEEISLEKTRPNPVTHLDEKLRQEVFKLITTVGKNGQIYSELKKLQSPTQSDAEYSEKLAFGLDPIVKNEVDRNKLKQILIRGVSQSATTTYFKNTELYKNISAGFDFDLNLAQLFNGNTAAKTHKEAHQPKKVRYGLILKNIKLSKMNLNYARAAMASDMQELAYAGTAEVTWTIGPIDEEPDLKIEKINLGDPQESNSAYNQHTSDDFIKTIDSQGVAPDFWEQAAVPRPHFKAKVKPLTDDTSIKRLLAGQKIGLAINIRQEQGLYELQQQLGDGTKDHPDAMTHIFKLPVYGTFSIGRRYNDKMKVVATSAENILLTKRLPSLSLHQFHDKEQLVVDAQADFGSVKVTAQASSNARKTNQTKLEETEHYKITIKKDF